MAIEQLARQATGAHRIFGGVATGGVRQNGVAIRRDHVEQIRFVRVLADIGATNRNGDNLGAAGFDRGARFVEIFVLAGADQQTRAIVFARQGKGVGLVHVLLPKIVALAAPVSATADGMDNLDPITLLQDLLVMT